MLYLCVMQSNSSRALGALCLLSLIWGYNWVVMKRVGAYIGPFDFSALRALFGALALFVVILLTRRPVRIAAPGKVIVLGLVQTSAFAGLTQWALVNGGAGKVAVLIYTMPFWLMLLARGWLGEKVSGVQWAAAAVAAVGLVLLFAPWAHDGTLFSSLLAVVGGFSWALASVLTKRMRREHDFDVLALTTWQMLFGALALSGVALCVPSQPIELTGYFFAALAFNAVLATALAWMLWIYVLNHLPVAVAGLSTLGIPLIGVVAGQLELGEHLGVTDVVGTVLIAAALAMMTLLTWWKQRRQIVP